MATNIEAFSRFRALYQNHVTKLKPIFLITHICLALTSCSHLASKKTWDAQAYNNNSASQSTAAHRVLSRVAFKGDERILDVGCGDGKITLEIAKEVPTGSVIGIDLSKPMVEFANTNFAQANLSFKQMDAANLEFDNEFNTVVSFSAMQWVINQSKALKGIFRSLKPDGIFLMTIPAGYPKALQAALDEMLESPPWQIYFDGFALGQKFLPKESYQSLLKEAGFANVSIDVIPAFDRFDSMLAFSNFVRQWLPHLAPIPKDLHDQFMNELISRYQKYEAPSADGSIWFNKYSLEALAKKPLPS